MGFAWKGICYQDAAGALDAFSRSMATVDSGGVSSLSGAPSISGAGLVSWSVAKTPFDGGAVSVQSGTTQLPSCVNPDFGQWSEQSMVFYLALFFAAFLGFRTGFRP